VLFENFRFLGTGLRHRNLSMRQPRMCVARGSTTALECRYRLLFIRATSMEGFVLSVVASPFMGKNKAGLQSLVPATILKRYEIDPERSVSNRAGLVALGHY